MDKHERWNAAMSEEVLIHDGDSLSEEDIDFLRGYSKNQISRIMEKGTKTKRLPYTYAVAVRCAKCGEKTIVKMPKTRVFDYLENGDYVCDICRQKEIIIKEKRARIAREQQKQEGVERLDRFIDIYLSPNKSWTIEPRKRFRYMMSQYPYGYDRNIAQAIQSMEYGEFLQTLYWKAIASAVRHNAKYQCQMCGVKHVPLFVHHNNYAIHGYEHREYKTGLICLCESCHKKFHLEAREP